MPAFRAAWPGIFDTDVELWTEVLRVNLIGPFLAIKHAAPKIAERGGGAIVLHRERRRAALGRGRPGLIRRRRRASSTSSQTAAQQLSGSNVRVNAICPGLIETGMTKRAFDYAREHGKEDRVGRLNPLRRGGEPEETRPRSRCSSPRDDASYVNGQAIVVDGGLSSSHPVTRQEFGKTAA